MYKIVKAKQLTGLIFLMKVEAPYVARVRGSEFTIVADTVILAMGAGKAAAKGIDDYLRQK